MIFEAREFAHRAHMAQARRYTGEPYFVHLEEVATIVESVRLPVPAIAAAWLHDVIEDQGISRPMLARLFGQEILEMVVALTDTPPRSGINRRQRKALDRDRLAATSMEVQTIKCADLISNASTIVKFDPNFARTYLVEKRATLDVLTRAHPGIRHYAEMSLRKAEAELLQLKLAPAVGVEPTGYGFGDHAAPSARR